MIGAAGSLAAFDSVVAAAACGCCLPPFPFDLLTGVLSLPRTVGAPNRTVFLSGRYETDRPKLAPLKAARAAAITIVVNVLQILGTRRGVRPSTVVVRSIRLLLCRSGCCCSCGHCGGLLTRGRLEEVSSPRIDAISEVTE